MVDSTYVGITSVAIFCVLVPSIWHFSAWNTATCYMMMWTTIGCIIHIVDGSIWYHNIHFPNEHEKIWCDIAAKLIIGLSVAIPLSSLCINRRLYNIAAVKTITVNKESKMRDALIDTIIAVVLPIIFMVVHYTMQGHRFDIIEDFGCWPSTYLTAPGYALIIAPPIVVSAVSLVFCTLSIRAFWHRRSEFNELLRSHSTGLTSSRYFRLMALASAEIIVGLPFAIFFFVVGIKHNGVAPWISWDDTHYNFSRIDYYVTYQLKRAGPGVYVSYQMSRWAFPFTAFIFFAFFGFAAEARKNYRMAFFRVLAPFGIKPRQTRPGTSRPTVSSIFGNRFDRFRRQNLNGTATTSDSVMVSLPRFVDRSGASVTRPPPAHRSSKSSMSSIPSLDLSALDALDDKKDDIFPSSSPSTSGSHEHIPAVVSESTDDLSALPHLRSSRPSSPIPRPTSFSHPPPAVLPTREGFVVRRELDAAQNV